MDEEENCSNRNSVKIDSKKFASILHFYSISFETAILCVIPDCALVIHIRLPYDCGSMTYYAPLLASDDIQDDTNLW